MPFQDKDVLPPSPTIQVFFFGLLLLFPEADGSCSVGVVRDADHVLSIDCWEVKPTPPNQPILRLSGPLRDASVGVSPPRYEKVAKYTPTLPDLTHFRRSIGFKGIHPNSTIIHSGFSSKISLMDGLLHTAMPTDQRMNVQLVCNGNYTDLGQIAAAIGANIYLGTTEKLLLKWTFMNGGTGELSFPIPKHTGSRYEIHIGNTPYLQVGKITHDDFSKYYNVVDVPPAQRCTLRFSSDFFNLEDLTASVDAPCMPGNHGG